MEENIYKGLPENLAKALKRLDILAGPEQLEYFYQLYDPKTGGFYYSLSSRDMEEMTPCSEGTCFVQEALVMGGMTLPDWYKEKVSEWILAHQDEGDGFFYEDLWGKITSGPRLNRDLAYSKSILNRCGKKPLYALPEERIKSGNTEGNTTLPAYLESEEAMFEYLESLDWSTKSIWSTGQKLTTARVLIEAAGLLQFTRDYIVKKQNPETGLFGEGLEWMNTNGSMKLSGFFAEDFPYPRVERAIESVKELYGGDIPPTSATFIWNPFVLLNRAIATQGDGAESARERLLDAGADIVNRAIDCALLLKREDGGFAGSLNAASKRQQGYLYGLAIPGESDLDGTLIAGPRLRSTIHGVFGVQATKDYYKKYNDEFWERCKNKAPVVKIYPRSEEALTPASAPVQYFSPKF